MDFGITFKGDISPARTKALCTQAEVAGFTYGWFFDSQPRVVEGLLSKYRYVYGAYRKYDFWTTSYQSWSS